METQFFQSFRDSDEETYANLAILGGKFYLETDGQKYDGFSGAKRPKNKKIGREAPENERKRSFLGLLFGQNPWCFAWLPLS